LTTTDEFLGTTASGGSGAPSCPSTSSGTPSAARPLADEMAARSASTGSDRPSNVTCRASRLATNVYRITLAIAAGEGGGGRWEGDERERGRGRVESRRRVEEERDH